MFEKVIIASMMFYFLNLINFEAIPSLTTSMVIIPCCRILHFVHVMICAVERAVMHGVAFTGRLTARPNSCHIGLLAGAGPGKQRVAQTGSPHAMGVCCTL